MAATVLLAACSGEVFDSISDYRAVVTVRLDKTEYQFRGLHTYQLTDTVIDLTARNQKHIDVVHSYDAVILDEIETQMETRGFVNIDDLADELTGVLPEPDVILVPGILAQNTWDYSGMMPWSDNNTSIYYTPPAVDLSYDVDSIILTMVSSNKMLENNPSAYYALWTAGIHASYTDMTEDTIRAGIATAFAQSPYIIAATVSGGTK